MEGETVSGTVDRPEGTEESALPEGVAAGRLIRRLDLHGLEGKGANLARATLKGVDLSAADLTNACLVGCTLDHVDLSGAHLGGADLRGVSMVDVDLTGADLHGANVHGATLRNSKIIEADLEGASLVAVSFEGVELLDSNLDGARLDGSRFEDSDVRACSARSSAWSGTRWTRCKLTALRFEDSDLSGTRFDQSSWDDVRLRHCQGRGISFRKTQFDGVEIEDCDWTAGFLEKCGGSSSEVVKHCVDASSNATVYAGQTVGTEVLQGEDRPILCNATLGRKGLEAADLHDCLMCNARLSRTDLTGANLSGADLRGAKLTGVKLTGADLQGADLRGASLNEVDLSDANLTGADLRGSYMEASTLGNACLDDARLDGADLVESSFQSTRLEGCTAQGASLTLCDARETQWTDCDLGGGAIVDTNLDRATFERCQLGGTLFKYAQMRATSIEDSRCAGSMFVTCNGLKPATMDQLVAGGAIYRLPWSSRLQRSLRGNRRLQGVAASVALGGTLVIAVAAFTPQTWPSFVHYFRLTAMERNWSEEHCPAFVTSAEILARRNTNADRRVFDILSTAANCYTAMNRPQDAERLMGELIEASAPGSEAWQRTHLQLGDFLFLQRRFEEAEALTKALIEEPLTSPLGRLRALVLLETVYQETSRSDANLADWLDVQQQIHDTLLEVSLDRGEYHEIASRNTVELAEMEVYSVAHLERAVNDATMTKAVALLEDTLASFELNDSLALELAWLDALRESEAIASSDVRWVAEYRSFELLLGAEREAEASAIEAAVAASESPVAAVTSRMMAARVSLIAGELQAAASVLESIEKPPAALAIPLLELNMDSALSAGDEDRAIEHFRKFLDGVTDERAAAISLSKAVEMAPRMASSDRLLALVAECDNPVVQSLGSEQFLTETIIQERIRQGTFGPDDPYARAVLRRGDAREIRYVWRQVLESAEAAGTWEDAAAQVTTLARDGNKVVRAELSILLLQHAYSTGRMSESHAIIEEFELRKKAEGEDRAVILEIDAGEAAESGDFVRLREIVEEAQRDRDEIGHGAVARLEERQIEAMSNESNWTETLQLARAALDSGNESHDERLLLTYIGTCHLELGQPAEAEAAFEDLAKVSGRCYALLTEARRRDSLEIGAADAPAMLGACAQADTPLFDRLDAATFLLDTGMFEQSLALSDVYGDSSIRPEEAARFAVIQARSQANLGDAELGTQLLADLYQRAGNPVARETLAMGRLELSGMQEDADALIRIYVDFTDENPDRSTPSLWMYAAQYLLQIGAVDRLDELGGEPSWRQEMGGEIQIASIRWLLDEGDFESTWLALETYDLTTTTPSRTMELVWLGQDLQSRTGLTERFVALLKLWRTQLAPGGEAHLSVTLTLADRLVAIQNHEEAIALLEGIDPSALEPNLRSVYLQNLGLCTGATGSVAEVQLALKQLETRGLDRNSILEVTLSAVGALLQRGQPADARIILKPLEGQRFDQALFHAHYSTLVRAWTDDALYSEVESLPDRYPPGEGVDICEVDNLLQRALPPDSEQGFTIRRRLLSDCAPDRLPAEANIALARSLVWGGQAEEAVTLLKACEKRSEDSSADEQMQFKITRAQALLTLEKSDEALRVLREVIRVSEESWIIAEAFQCIVNEIYSKRGVSSKQVLAEAEAVLQRIGPESDAGRTVVFSLADYLAAEGRLAEAMEWHGRAMATLPSGEERAYALIRMARLEITAQGPSSKSGHARLEEARGMIPPRHWAEMEIHQLLAATEIATERPNPTQLRDLLEEHMKELSKEEHDVLISETGRELRSMGLDTLADEVERFEVEPASP